MQGLCLYQSGRPDLNRRPPEPHSGALPGCATSRPPAETRWRKNTKANRAPPPGQAAANGAITSTPPPSRSPGSRTRPLPHPAPARTPACHASHSHSRSHRPLQSARLHALCCTSRPLGPAPSPFPATPLNPLRHNFLTRRGGPCQNIWRLPCPVFRSSPTKRSRRRPAPYPGHGTLRSTAREQPRNRCSEQTRRKPATQSHGATARPLATPAGPPAENP
jgi:hypothetical protein